MSSGDRLPAVAWRWIPSEVWGEYAVTCRPGDALMAKETGLVEVEELVRKSDALAEREEDRALMREALEALENGRRVRNCEGGTKYQPPLEDAAISKLRARVG
jgi:hypothetical protein